MSGLAGTRVLVTGAGGFIGSHVVERLVRDGARVRGMVRYTSRGDHGALDWLDAQTTGEVEVVTGELRDLESVERAVEGSEIVLHLGAQIAIPYSYVNPRDYLETNAIGTLNVCLAAQRHGVTRVVGTSTSEVYGTAQTIPITESHPLEPQSPYAASKVASDKVIDACQRSFELNAMVLRPFNTYGPRQSARAVIPTIITQALAGGPLKLGALDPRRDLTFAADTADGFVRAATAPGVEGRTIQLGTNHDVSVADIVGVVGEIVGRELEVQLDPQRVRPAKSEVLRLISDPALATELLGWTPTVDLRTGLERTVAYIEANQGRYRTGEYAV
jgi:NAD dependent epimerase/dehydratase